MTRAEFMSLRDREFVQACRSMGMGYLRIMFGEILPNALTVRAVDDVSVDLDAGETVGLVGESGCGKSTLGKAVMRLVPSSDGIVVLDGQNLTEMQPRALKAARRNIQMIFQDPYSSLNPRHDIGTIVGQPLSVAG
ncbi:MAG: ATP-binding cassette domain-containing protein, partial [Xanthobacteraceae bacterium]